MRFQAFLIGILPLIHAQVVEDTASAQRPLDVKFGVSFPDSPFTPITVVNGKKTRAVVTLDNQEDQDLTIEFIGGAVWRPGWDVVVRNLTAMRFATKVPAGENRELQYGFTEDLHPTEMGLHLGAVVGMENGRTFSLLAYNSTVIFTDPEPSWFDPQLLFLYVFLAVVFGGIGYMVYATWLSNLMPQKPKRRPAKAAAASTKTAEKNTAQAYNAEWIPEHHLGKTKVSRRKSKGGNKSE